MVGADQFESLFALGFAVQLQKVGQAAVLACERGETLGGLGEDDKSEPVPNWFALLLPTLYLPSADPPTNTTGDFRNPAHERHTLTQVSL